MRLSEPWPQTLLLCVQTIVPGAREDYLRIEAEIARTLAALGAPHDYLALESVAAGAPSIWFLSGFRSIAHYETARQSWNHLRQDKLVELGRRKDPLTLGTLEQMLHRHGPRIHPVSVDSPHIVAAARIPSRSRMGAATYSGDDGVHYAFACMDSPLAAIDEAARLGGVALGHLPSCSYPPS